MIRLLKALQFPFQICIVVCCIYYVYKYRLYIYVYIYIYYIYIKYITFIHIYIYVLYMYVYVYIYILAKYMEKYRSLILTSLQRICRTIYGKLLPIIFMINSLIKGPSLGRDYLPQQILFVIRRDHEKY